MTPSRFIMMMSDHEKMGAIANQRTTSASSVRSPVSLSLRAAGEFPAVRPDTVRSWSAGATNAPQVR